MTDSKQNNDLIELLKQVPAKPGVYLFKNAQGEIIYIGKAKSLRSRVRSYFQSGKHQTAKTLSMVKQIAGLEWIVVRSEVEALLTEANMIKEHDPRYNIDLKDDKSFPFIRVTREPYPQVFLTRTIVKDGSRYFGPYTDVLLLKRTLKALYKVFPIRSCTHYLDDEIVQAGKIAVCLDYHIKKCEGPCAGHVTQAEYLDMVRLVVRFLQGDTAQTEAYIRTRMEAAAAALCFEDAAQYRDQLAAIESFRVRQRKVAADFEDRDVFALARQDDSAVATVIRIRQGRIFTREKFRLRNLDFDTDVILKHLITGFYLEGDFIPAELLVPTVPADREGLLEWLKSKRGRTVNLVLPQRGEKAKLLKMAEKNARLLLSEWILERMKRQELVPASVTQLQEDLQLKAPPRRIEAFDISHLGGTNTVASLVCFIDGKPRKSEYRKFNVKTVVGIDDFAAMREVVLRRYHRQKQEQKQLPDLILIDGGKGQLGMAVSALRELGLDYLPIIGLAKRLEEVFVPGISEPQSIPKTSPGLFLLRRIRDEAHRSAITFQRSKRDAAATESIFSSVPGIGTKRLQKLLTAYPDVATIAGEDPSALALRTAFTENLAENVIAVAQKFIAQKNAGNHDRPS
ncbi:MAG: excinuclease ABC subunit UvrC [Candidatus Neomarinimicrobiota bacterium]